MHRAATWLNSKGMKIYMLACSAFICCLSAWTLGTELARIWSGKEEQRWLWISPLISILIWSSMFVWTLLRDRLVEDPADD